MSSWIFQGNPKNFRVDEYLQRQNVILWTIRQSHFADKISVGDEVYIWRSDGDKPKSGGIIAKGRIVSNPQNIEDDAPELWIEPQEKIIALRVKIELEEICLTEGKGMLKRIDLKRDPI